MNDSAAICVDLDVHPPSSSGGRTVTFVSLIRSDVSKLNTFKTLENEECRVPSTKLKPHYMLIQLMSCGSISVKDQRFGLLRTYKSRLSFGKLDCLRRNNRLMSLSFEDGEYFYTSWTESTITKEKQQSSFFTTERLVF
ncbi:hypothetical protein T459_04245 [Capsicum annuum]|uniref:Uncharacterized protein n=1 Tax=Capsicum annuum TaxID=4072 RepID=A0A2G3A4H4_CAPAN|nr:hypothetical protein T459_04245 [Capsicum annuum]